MKTISDSTIAAINNLSPDTLEAHGVIQRARTGYICPLCDNGKHEDGTGISPHVTDHVGWKCHRCGESFNNIRIFAAHYGLNPKSDFVQLCEKICADFGITADFDVPTVNASERKNTVPPAVLNFINSDINTDIEPLRAFLAAQGVSWRGLPLEILERFSCRYIPNWTFPTARAANKFCTPSPRMIIPANSDGLHSNYLARLTCKLSDFDETSRQYIKEKPHAGAKTLFNPDALSADVIFAVEGYIDAMSIEYVGFNAVAMGGADSYQLLVDALKPLAKKPRVIILFDFDDAGRTHSSKLNRELAQIDCPAVIRFLSDVDSKLDANQILQEHGVEHLREKLRAIEQDARADFETLEKEISARRLFNEQIDAWQAVHGDIDPHLISKIKVAAEFVDNLTSFNFAPSFAFDVATRNNVALLKFYLPELAEKFFATLKTSRDLAKDALALIKKESGNNDVVGLPQLKKLATIAPGKIESEIEPLVTAIRKDHKIFLYNQYAQSRNEQLKAQQEAEIKRRQSETTATNAKGCPVALKIPFDCYFSEKGVSLIDNSGKFSKTIAATKNPIVPTKILREPNNHSVQYEVAIKTGNIWRKMIVDGRVLFDSKQILALADKGAWIAEPKALTKFFASIISENQGDIPEIKCYQQTGWTDDTFKTFAYPNIADHIVRRAGFDFDKILAQRGNAELWKQKFIEVTDKGGAVAALYIGTALAAILARPLNIMNPQTHLLGTSGSGKTALQKFTASIFGNPRELIRTFAATNKNRQLVAAAFCDLPTFLDELETVQGKNAEDSISNDIYNFADGKGNQANKRDGTARETFKFGGSRLTTGERPLLKNNDLRGAFKRLIQLDVHNSLFNDDFAASLHVFSESNWGHFGGAWIQFTIENMAEIQAQYQRRASRRDPTTISYEPTHLSSICASLVAFEFFKVMLGITAEFDALSFVRNRRVIVDALPTIADIDDTTRALDALRSFVSSHEKSFIRDETDSDTNKTVEIGAWGTVCSGKIFDTGAVAVFPTELKRILEEELHFPSADKLINEWIRDGTLQVDIGRKNKVIKIDKKPRRVCYFKAGTISDSNDSVESDYYETFSKL